MSRKQKIIDLMHATERMQSMTVEEACKRFNPDNDPRVTELITRLLTPGQHLAGRH